MSPLDRLDWLAALSTDQRLSERALRLAAQIAAHVHRDGRAVVPMTDILAALPVSKDTLRRAQADLERGGWLEVTGGRGRGNAKSYQPKMPTMMNGKRSQLIATFSERDELTEKVAQKVAQKVATMCDPPWVTKG